MNVSNFGISDASEKNVLKAGLIYVNWAAAGSYAKKSIEELSASKENKECVMKTIR
ncbi:hypothetical protein GCM10011418_35360 [Sphingobacterium alkalisoli]|nr:hypothetical protein GCM10011418_35360 [Sphingobacterium alkalisoli]